MAICLITYHLLKDPTVHRKVRTELLSAASDPSDVPSWTALEKLPYFKAVVLEGLRLMYQTVFGIDVPCRDVEPRFLFKNAPWKAIRDRISRELK
ncbi:hypothetical protein O9K51_10829 [Purpureocillium lavendulum]|uniref:Uncharacterized protein n=1 Tax=Purpureocillium lavendulum TaxID=1247861 RepID=A0AB34FCK3_9HYPO|nr:hypothetical protein O9K51_10829 [Purpureocillium lavendulum]